MTPKETPSLEVLAERQEELRREVRGHDRTLYNDGFGIKKKVDLMWEWYLSRKRIETALIVALMLNFVASLWNLLKG